MCLFVFCWKKLRGETHLTKTHAFIVWPVGSTFAGPTEGSHSRPGWICCWENRNENNGCCFCCLYAPLKINIKTWRWWFGRWCSSSRGEFAGSMFIFRGVMSILTQMGSTGANSKMKDETISHIIQAWYIYLHLTIKINHSCMYNYIPYMDTMRMLSCMFWDQVTCCGRQPAWEVWRIWPFNTYWGNVRLQSLILFHVVAMNTWIHVFSICIIIYIYNVLLYFYIYIYTFINIHMMYNI